MTRSASVIVRCRDSERTIERTFRVMRAQTVEAEIVVVDSGSRDRTLEIARQWADRIVQLSPATFSYGRALNRGADAASGEIHFALSAHCAPPRRDWIERSLEHYESPAVGATNGADGPVPGHRRLGSGAPGGDVFHQDNVHARAHPYWGFSNHASSWRAAVWANHRFDEQLAAAEDKEWALRVTAAGWLIAYDPALAVSQAHAWRSAHAFYRRRRKEACAIASFAEVAPYRLRDLLRDWWNDVPEDRHSVLFHRLVNYRRLAGLAGRYAGHRRGMRQRCGD
jgi:glycosyltransferase involved in cell wall biosynthesis